MPIVKDPIVGLIRRDDGGRGDPVLEALRRGDDIPDRRANLLRLAWDQTMPYEEAERLLPDDEMDELCDLLDDVRMYGIVHCVYQLMAAQRNGWILSDEDRAWYRLRMRVAPRTRMDRLGRSAALALAHRGSESPTKSSTWLGGYWTRASTMRNSRRASRLRSWGESLRSSIRRLCAATQLLLLKLSAPAGSLRMRRGMSRITPRTRDLHDPLRTSHATSDAAHPATVARRDSRRMRRPCVRSVSTWRQEALACPHERVPHSCAP